MKFDVLKDVMIDGVKYDAGSVVEINHDKTARLEMLGYIQPKSEKQNRAVGVDGSEKPKTRRKKSD